MTFDEAVARIQQGLGWRADKSTQIKSAIKEAQRWLEMQPVLPWFLKAEDVSATGSANVATANLPSLFLKEFEDDGVKFYKDSVYTPMVKASFNRLTQVYQMLAVNDDPTETTDTKAVAYVLLKTTFKIYPTPTFAWTTKWTYYKGGTVLSAGSDTNIWLDETYLPEILLGRAGIIMAKDLRDKEALETFTDMFQSGMLAASMKTVDREAAEQPILRGSLI